ncbi:DUF4260 domain-containing protein [Altibacter sp.]|uniref:DUF4260 domain-containing protein n=1 Tax=Altibacter sp. TaxID=2024823 RepID=UPI000C92DE8D|nr:DUF4260 domain-containing protein [Altibacter sp.]MAP55507.1 hypothetical protein [Altibacter sp.]
MKTTLRIEELAQFVLGVLLFSSLDYAWYWFPLLLLLPDVGMLGYLFGPKIGAFTYNLLHHKAVAIAFITLGMWFLGDFYTLVGVVMFAHAGIDRVFGYGLKYPDSFKHTHLGTIGKK